MSLKMSVLLAVCVVIGVTTALPTGSTDDSDWEAFLMEYSESMRDI